MTVKDLKERLAGFEDSRELEAECEFDAETIGVGIWVRRAGGGRDLLLTSDVDARDLWGAVE